MNKKILYVVAALAFAAGTPAFAEEGDPPPPPPPPSQPSLPYGVSQTGSFFLYPSGNVVQGQIQQSIWWTFGGGAGDPYTNQLLQLGDSSSSVQLQLTKGPIASSYASATQAPVYGRSQAGAQFGYSVTLTANDEASAQYIQSQLATSGAIASVSGLFKLTGSNYGYSSASASTGQLDGLDAGLGATAYASCGSYGEVTDANTAGCGTSGFTLPVNFVAGSYFSDGAPMSFYSVITLSSNANAGVSGCCSGPYYGGTASAFVDPTITLAAGINATVTLGVNGEVGNESPVPEPAQWALMASGLLGLAGWGRKRRHMLRRT